MELRSHIQILTKAKWFVLVFTALVAIIAITFSMTRPVRYQAVVSFDIAFVNQSSTPDYQYAAYYEQRSAEIYAQTMMSWLRTPAVVKEIYDAANVGYTIDSVARFTNRFQAKQYGAQNVVVFFDDVNEENAEQLSVGLISVMEQRSEEIASVGESNVFEVRGLEPVVVQKEVNPFLVAVVSIIAGFIASVILVYIREYFRS